jgi:hypothetical protein
MKLKFSPEKLRTTYVGRDQNSTPAQTRKNTIFSTKTSHQEPHIMQITVHPLSALLAITVSDWRETTATLSNNKLLKKL